MARTYLPERQVEYWTSRQVEDFFLNAGYQISVFPLQQSVEKHIPADHIFRSPGLVKLFGIQYKALYHNGDDFWKLTQHQHTAMTRFGWIYYGLSDMKEAKQYRNSLHYLRMYKPDFDFTVRFAGSKDIFYWRWAMFFEKLKSCSFGVRVDSEDDLRGNLGKFASDTPDHVQREVDNIVDVFAVNLASHIGVRVSTQFDISLLPPPPEDEA